MTNLKHLFLPCLLMMGVLCAGNPIHAQPSPTNSKGTKFTMQSSSALTNWFRKAGYGVFMHFLPGDGESLRKVEKFDVDALASQLREVGAKYLVITLGQ